MSYDRTKPITSLIIVKCPDGGFVVRTHDEWHNGSCSVMMLACTTIAEALTYIKGKMVER